MKKYIAPSVEILSINTENMMALSAIYNEQSTSDQLSNSLEDFDLGWTEE